MRRRVPHYLVLLAMFLLQRPLGATVTPPRHSLQEEEPHTETCRLHRIVHKVTVKNCKSRRMLSWACQGSCLSYAQLAGDKETHIERYCTCCQETKVVPRNFSLTCRGFKGPQSFRKVVTRIMLPTSCLCRPCSAGVGIQPLEFAGIGDKRNLWSVI